MSGSALHFVTFHCISCECQCIAFRHTSLHFIGVPYCIAFRHTSSRFHQLLQCHVKSYGWWDQVLVLSKQYQRHIWRNTSMSNTCIAFNAYLNLGDLESHLDISRFILKFENAFSQCEMQLDMKECICSYNLFCCWCSLPFPPWQHEFVFVLVFLFVVGALFLPWQHKLCNVSSECIWETARMCFHSQLFGLFSKLFVLFCSLFGLLTDFSSC